MPRAAFDDVRIDGYAAAGIVPFFDASDLRGEFVNGVDSFFRDRARRERRGRER